jgi:hypothetical protein
MKKEFHPKGCIQNEEKGGILNSVGWRDSHLTMIGGEQNRIDFIIKFIGLLS